MQSVTHESSQLPGKEPTVNRPNSQSKISSFFPNFNKKNLILKLKKKILLSPCQSSNTTSYETIPDVWSDYVEPPSKSATASNDLRSDDDATEIETSEVVKKKIWLPDICESNKI